MTLMQVYAGVAVDAGLADDLRRTRWSLTHGVLCLGDDIDALELALDAVRTAEELAAFRRLCLRWLYATEPVPEWCDWRQELESSRN